MSNAIEIHQSLFQSKLKTLTGAMVPNPPPPTLHVMVATGLHADVSCDLSKPTLTIGSDAGCDLVLLDDHIADTHAKISVNHSVLGHVLQIETTQKDVQLDGAPVVPGSPSAFDTLPARLELGSVTLHFTSGRAAKARKAKALTDMAINAGFVVLMFLLVLMAIDFASQAVAESQPEIEIAAEAEPEPMSKGPPISAKLQTKIDEAGLSNELTLADDATGLLVTGSLTPVQMQNWQSIHRWFDAQPGGQLLTAQVSQAPVLDAFPPIASIRLGTTPQVRFLNGKIVGVGDAVQDGWVVTGITAEGLALQNDQKSANIAF